jgi:hypothetical protein
MGNKRILTEEQRKMLLGHAPFSNGVTIDFSPKEYANISDESVRSVYQIRSFTQDEQIALSTVQQAYLNDDTNTTARQALIDKKAELAAACVMGWKNRFDVGTMNEIDFSEENKSTIPRWELFEIIAFVCDISFLTPPEELSVK